MKQVSSCVQVASDFKQWWLETRSLVFCLQTVLRGAMYFQSPLNARTKTEGKACLFLYACNLTRGFFIEVLPNLETSEFLQSLKQLISCCGDPVKMWLKQTVHDEKIQDYLTHRTLSTNSASATPLGGEVRLSVSLYWSNLL